MKNLEWDQLLHMPRNKKILITGGLGCLGLNIATYLSKKGYKLILIDNLKTNVISPDLIPQNINFFYCNIKNFKKLEKIFHNTRPDYVIHSAASYKNPNDWIGDIKTNVVGMVNLIKLSEKFDIKKFINFQTIHCYEKKNIVDEKSNKSPKESYSITKVTAEEILTLSSLNFISLRLTIIFGPYHFNGPIPIFFKNISQNKH